ncbi:MAG: 4Fe-4S dicluster domain-containing protein [Bacteriovoracaceae bacterium]|nr:4Fe-4S dicluster domain-containing protein [Bacteriovoracaceae bacterium]
MNTTLATREIMWNIPDSYKVVMYILFFIAVGIFFYGSYLKYQYVTGGKGLKPLLPERLNWSRFFKTIFLQGKVKRDSFVGFFHAMIFYGFIILWIATDLVAVHYDTPFKVFQGTTYIVISFLADIGGVTILLGLMFAFYRRYILKPSYLAATKPKQELYMYITLAVLTLVGFALEGIRILGTGMPINESVWSPVGWFLASAIQKMAMPEETLAGLYRGLWFFHMVNTMVFVASIPFSKFLHILSLPFASLITPERRGAILKPMNFEDDTKETFGLGKLSEMTAKNRLDTISCVECGRCTQVCPANLAEKPLNPKTIITKARDAAAGLTKGQDVDFWEKNLYEMNELDACTTCGACMEECPANIEHVDIIMNLKRYKALTLGTLPPAAADAANKIKVNGNPWGIAQDDRFKWADGMDVPVIETGKKVDYLYYVGCAGSYDASNQKVVKDTVMMLKKAGVSFAVMGKTEKCNGDPVRRFGDEYTFFELAIENIANMKQYQFDKVVTHCPHCLHTIGKEYAKFENGSFDTVHHTELLADLVNTGKLKPTKVVQSELTFHDPCYLGRHHGAYNPPREILNSIPGVKLKEMEKNKDKALCCGMGGGNMWYEINQGKHLAENRLDHIAETTVNKLATSCSYCMINFNSSKGLNNKTENLEVEDVASILAKSVLD